DSLIDRPGDAVDRCAGAGGAVGGLSGGAVGGDGHQVVDDVPVVGMDLPDAHQPAAVGRDDGAGVADRRRGRRLGGQRFGNPAVVQPVQPLVGQVGEVGGPVLDGGAQPAVLVHEGPR